VTALAVGMATWLRDEEAKLRGFGHGLAPAVQSWDIRGMKTSTRSTLAIVLPGGERSPSPNRDRL
jgi:hypothetical protein